MKKQAVFFSALLAFSLLNGAQFLNSGRENTLKTESDSVYAVFDDNYEDMTLLERNSKGKASIFIPEGVKCIGIVSMSDSLEAVFAVKNSGKVLKETYLYMGDLFDEYGLIDSALYYYEKEFNSNNGSYEAYENLIKKSVKKDSESREKYIDKYINKYPNSKIVLLVSAESYFSTDEESLGLIYLRKGMKMPDKSKEYFYLILNSLYYDKQITDDEGFELVKYSLDNYSDMDEIDMILYILNTRYSTKDYAARIDNTLEGILRKGIDDQNGFYLTAYLVDNEMMLQFADSNMYSYLNSDLYDAYGDLLLFYAAKVKYALKEYEDAKAFIDKAESEYTEFDRDFYELKFNNDKELNAKDRLYDDAIRLLTYNDNDSEILSYIETNFKKSGKDIQKSIDKMLSKESIDRKLPEYKLKSALNDSIVSSEKYKGRIVLIDFFATWCNPCRKEIEELKKLKSELSSMKGGPEVVYLAISSEKDRETIIKFAEEREFDFEKFYDAKDVYDSEDIKGVPTIYLIDRKGNVRFVKVGYAEYSKSFLMTRIKFLSRGK